MERKNKYMISKSVTDSNQSIDREAKSELVPKQSAASPEEIQQPAYEIHIELGGAH
jgi:hypothetical protein